MNRREVLASGVLTGVGAALGSGEVLGRSRRGEPFKLKYGPHLGMFRAHAGDDAIDQIRFMADEGFRAFEDNGMPGRPPELQERIGATLKELGMTMGVFVAEADFSKVTFARRDDETKQYVREKMQRAVEVAKRCGAKWCTVVPGRYDQRLDWDYQTAYVVDNLKRCCEILDPAGLTMVLEPLNRRDHPGLFLTGMPQAFLICEAVASPSCKILDDLYHQQITEGNLIPNLERSWSEIAYFQVGDNPGRKEPTTGEINYRNVFKKLHERGFDGVIGMEHGNSRPGKDGERALIEAYRWCDAFEVG
ncbi:MAG: TIM barrel protein [Planctomycetota bacterium]